MITQATLNCLAKFKVTCSAGRIRKKLDVLGQNHDQKVMEVRTQIAEQQQKISEKEATLSNFDQRCNEDHVCSTLCVEEKNELIKDLKERKLHAHTGFSIIFDNIDGKTTRRHMAKDNQNSDYHWVNHKVVLNRVSGNMLNSSPTNVLNIPNIKLLPSVQDQTRQRQNYIVLVSRILVKYLESFGMFDDVCIQHIPHKYSKEAAKKSETVSELEQYTLVLYTSVQLTNDLNLGNKEEQDRRPITFCSP